jgi:predicted nucleic acid-binding protein
VKVLLDTNVILSLVENERGSEAGRRILDDPDVRSCITPLNLMEFRHVLIKGKHEERETVRRLVGYLKQRVDEVITDMPSFETIDDSHAETLLDPPDCVLYVTAEVVDATFVSAERELQDHGALAPEEVV